MSRAHQLFLAISTVAFAGTAQAYVAGGHEYDATCNADGYILTSKYPVARTVGQGANTQFFSGIEKLYLGRSCDAAHAIYGTGRWCWANGGFLAEFEDAQFGFGRQELYCESEDDLGFGCICE